MYLVNVEFIKENDDLIIIDCRYDMANPPFGYEEYKKGHLKGAYYIDLDKDMTGDVSVHGGRHPLPDMDEFARKMSTLKIKKDSKILVYDNGELPMAARLWFMLNLIGLREVYILEGGYDELVKSDMEITTEEPDYDFDNELSVDIQSQLICDVDCVKASMDNEKSVIVDSRSKPRYLGLEEPFDKIAGHIPTAINYFWKDNFEGLKVKDYGKLQAAFLEMNNYEEVIVHCGSGITGCVNMFLLNEIGIKSKLYLGSYSDWLSYGENEIIVKNNEVRKVDA